MWILIDRDGECWPERSRQLLQRLSVEATPLELRDFVTRNMGYVALRRGRDSQIVQLNPSLVTPLGIAEAVRLVRVSGDRILLNYFVGDWHHEIVGSCRILAARLSRLMEEARPNPKSRFARTPCQPEDVARGPASSLSRIIDTWRSACDGRGEVRDFLAQIAASRFVLAELDDERGELKLNRVSRSLKISNFFPEGRPRALLEHPDRDYATWASRHYLECLATGVPTLDHVTASVLLDENRSHNVRYTRLLLPLSQKLLLSATVAA
ncbi:MAG: hypothetical protein JSS20_15515 [Proteobacteria bacterium]|nr:hypothetical protein [Pseudomonadota bacterium]